MSSSFEAESSVKFQRNQSCSMSDSVDCQDFKALLDQLKHHLLDDQNHRKQLNLRLKLIDQLHVLVGVTYSSNSTYNCSFDGDVREGNRCLHGTDEQFQEAGALATDPDYHSAEFGQPMSQPHERRNYSADANGQWLSLERQLRVQNSSLTQLHRKLDELANDQQMQLSLTNRIWQQNMHTLTESTKKENQPGEANNKLADSDMNDELQSAELMSCRMQMQRLQMQLDEANKNMVDSVAKNEQLRTELSNCKLELLTSQELAARTKLRELKKLEELNETDEIKSMISRLQADTATIADYIKKHTNSTHHYESDESEPMDTKGSHSPDHLQGLRNNYRQLTEMLEARKVAAYMYEHDALTFSELHSIQRCSTPSNAAEDLLRVVSGAGNNVRIYECFMSALQETDQQHIWSSLSHDGCDINRKHVQLIKSHYSFLVNTIEHSRLLAELYARGVIDIQDKEYLEGEKIAFKRNQKLLSMLVRKTEQQFELFLDCLNGTGQRHVVKKLRGNLDSPGASSENTKHQSTSRRGPNPLQTTVQLSAGTSLSHVISSKDRGGVVGVTVCDEAFFVLRGESRELIEHYDIRSFEELTAIRVKGLGVSDGDLSWGYKSLTSCCINNCLYVNDRYTVFRVDLSTEKVISWPVDGLSCGLSVNSTGNVLVTCRDDNKIIEYSTRGSLVRSIQLQGNHVTHPSHTVQLTDGRYVVCHQGPVEGVSLIDQHGSLITSYRNSETTQVMNRPRWIIVVDDCMLVASRNNNRILSLNSTFNVARELSLPVDTRLNGPCCMFFDQSMGRLFVGEWYGERVLVFDNIR